MRESAERLIRKLRGGEGPLASVFRGAGATFVIKAAGAGLAYLMELLLARWLGPEYYGQYTYALAWAALLVIPATLGLQGGVLRFLPEHESRGEWDLVRGLTVRSWQLTLAAAFGVGVLGMAGVRILDAELGLDYANVLTAGMGLVPCLALLNLHEGFGRGLGSVRLAFGPKKIARPLLIIGSLFAYRELWGGLTGRTAVLVTVGVLAAVAAGQGAFVWKALPRKAREVSASFRTKKWLRVSLPLLLITGFLLILNRTDLIMLGMFAEAREVGVYNAAAKTARLVSFVLVAVNALAAPTISRLYNEERREDLQRLATAVAQYAFWPSVAIAGGLMLLSGAILGLFGPDFVDGGPVLAILALGQVVNAGVGSVGYFMNMTGHQDESARVFGVTALVNIALNGAAIPVFGAVGAAVATALSMAMWNVWLNRMVWRRLEIRTSVVSAWIGD